MQVEQKQLSNQEKLEKKTEVQNKVQAILSDQQKRKVDEATVLT